MQKYKKVIDSLNGFLQYSNAKDNSNEYDVTFYLLIYFGNVILFEVFFYLNLNSKESQTSYTKV